MKAFLYNKFYPAWKTQCATHLKKKRLKFINHLLSGKLFDQSWLRGKKLLEVGCANGKDFIQFLNHPELHITAVDIGDYVIKQENVTFMNVDAEKLPFDDGHFDLCVSFGVLEHIQPIEKLCRVISEVDRVSRSFVMLVPSVSTFFEPHTTEIFWQLRRAEKKRAYTRLNYFSDEAWLQFQGFSKAHIKRYSYIPFLIRNTIIYKLEEK